MSQWLLKLHIVAIFTGLMLLVSDRLNECKFTKACLGIWFFICIIVTIMHMAGVVQ